MEQSVNQEQMRVHGVAGVQQSIERIEEMLPLAIQAKVASQGTSNGPTEPTEEVLSLREENRRLQEENSALRDEKKQITENFKVLMNCFTYCPPFQPNPSREERNCLYKWR